MIKRIEEPAKLNIIIPGVDCAMPTGNAGLELSHNIRHGLQTTLYPKIMEGLLQYAEIFKKINPRLAGFIIEEIQMKGFQREQIILNAIGFDILLRIIELKCEDEILESFLQFLVENNFADVHIIVDALSDGYNSQLVNFAINNINTFRDFKDMYKLANHYKKKNAKNGNKVLSILSSKFDTLLPKFAREIKETEYDNLLISSIKMHIKECDYNLEDFI